MQSVESDFIKVVLKGDLTEELLYPDWQQELENFGFIFHTKQSIYITNADIVVIKFFDYSFNSGSFFIKRIQPESGLTECVYYVSQFVSDLYISDSNIEQLDLSTNKTIRKLNIFRCRNFTTLTLGNKEISQLKYLTVQYCPLGQLNASHTQLESLQCESCQLEVLELPQTLKTLSCSHNKLQQLEIPNSLETIYASDNKFNKLDLRQTKSLCTSVHADVLYLPDAFRFIQDGSQLPMDIVFRNKVYKMKKRERETPIRGNERERPATKKPINLIFSDDDVLKYIEENPYPKFLRQPGNLRIKNYSKCLGNFMKGVKIFNQSIQNLDEVKCWK